MFIPLGFPCVRFLYCPCACAFLVSVVLVPARSLSTWSLCPRVLHPCHPRACLFRVLGFPRALFMATNRVFFCVSLLNFCNDDDDNGADNDDLENGYDDGLQLQDE